MKETRIDAIPDLSDVQVIVFTEFSGQAPQVVEDQVTYPITTKMLAVPYAKVVRGYSFFGFSFVYVIFEDGTDLYWARSRVLEYLSGLTSDLPQGVSPQLGPDATGVGWAFMYVLNSDRRSLADLRSYQDWYLKYGLSSVEGVAEVASIGGFVRQYQVEVDPVRLRAYGLPLQAVRQSDPALERRGRWPVGRDVRARVHGSRAGLRQGDSGSRRRSSGERSGRCADRPARTWPTSRSGLRFAGGWLDWNGEGETVGRRGRSPLGCGHLVHDREGQGTPGGAQGWACLRMSRSPSPTTAPDSSSVRSKP